NNEYLRIDNKFYRTNHQRDSSGELQRGIFRPNNSTDRFDVERVGDRWNIRPNELKLRGGAMPTIGTDDPSVPVRSLYRVDNRKFGDLTDAGFVPWAPLSTDQARKFFKNFLGNADASGLPSDLYTGSGGAKPTLGTLSNYIKYKKDRSTNWVSSAINTEGGGQSAGAPLYQFDTKLFAYEISRGQLVPLPNGRTGNLKPALLMDGKDIDSSTIFAIDHGKLDDAEISFFSPIPKSHVRQL
ncbi:hypothetical protein, partial [Burkholderia lata]|uniref:hypothetical protein n=1 Tax=Burkholderia lata (strain ATCC 17760 / DSM 23089 / LMG 22485 / NCIMB 9086 / R18194 / 383) TaxID=482957 RepID=UPI001584297F